MSTNQEELQALLRRVNMQIGDLNYNVAILRGHANNPELSAVHLRNCMRYVADSLEKLSKEMGVWEK